MQRRKFIRLSAFTAFVLLQGCTSGDNNISTNSSTQDSTSSTLLIPPLLNGVDKNSEGILHFDISIQESSKVFFNGSNTKTFAMNGDYLGPTIKLRNTQKVSINYTNNLKENTTMHGHGMHVPPIMDGGAHQIILPGDTFSAVYTVKQTACTNWYHPHLMGKTAEHVYKGLAGLIIIEDSISDSLDLPKTYGVDDIPLILQDKVFDSNNQIDYSPSQMQIMRGYIGNHFLANGTINAFLDVSAKEIRFRILNGSNSSVYDLGFTDGRTFKQITTDNSFLEAPVNLKRVQLSPGERAEIIVDFTNDFTKELIFKDFTYNKDFLKIKVSSQASSHTTTPDTLTSLTKYTLNESTNTRRFVLSGGMGNLLINGVSMNINVINEQVPLNQIETWEIQNNMGMNHNFHIHATHFYIVQRNGSSANVAENEKAYKDTVFIPPYSSVTVMVKMTDYIDSTNPYMYHCHFLEHEDAGMMGQFTVV